MIFKDTNFSRRDAEGPSDRGSGPDPRRGRSDEGSFRLTVWGVWAAGVLGAWIALHWPICNPGDIVPPDVVRALLGGSCDPAGRSPVPHLLVPLGVCLLTLPGGLAVLRAVGPAGLNDLELVGFGVSFGLGLFATGIAWLALVGLLNGPAMAELLGVLAATGWLWTPSHDIRLYRLKRRPRGRAG